MPFLFFIAIVAVTAVIYTNMTEEATTVKKYFSKISDHDYEAAYEYVYTNLSKEDFISKIKNVYEGIESRDIGVKIVGKTFDKSGDESNDSKITYNVSMNSVAGKFNYTNISNLKKIDGKYKIDWQISDIYPDLKENQTIRVKTIDYKRGTIYDRNGHAIAKDSNAYYIGIVPGKLEKSDISKVASILEIDKKEIEDKIKSDYVTENTFVPLKKISREEQEKKNSLLKIKGIMVSDVQVRTYPYKEATSILTGYVQDDEGKAGLEQSLNDTLKGTFGKEIYIDYDSTKVKSIAKTDKVDGKDVKLTIDIDLQQKAYEEFKEERGAVVSLNYKTGEVLALVSTPSYDANKISLGISNKDWDKLQKDENHPMLNRFASTYAPGSSMKPIIGAIGLQNNIFTKSDDFGKSGLKWQKDKSWKDFYITTLESYNETANLENALVYSDNIYFAKAALKLGKDLIKTGLNQFGFEEKLDFNLDIQNSTYGKLDSEKSIANTGYGQAEVLASPVLMASIYSTFANNGNMIKPYLILEEKDEDKAKYYKENLIDEGVATTIKEDLIQVVKRGTAKSAYMEDKVIAGKTGTAEIKKSQEDKNGSEIGWFNSFDDNDLLIVGMIENVKDKGGSDMIVKKVANIYK